MPWKRLCASCSRQINPCYWWNWANAASLLQQGQSGFRCFAWAWAWASSSGFANTFFFFLFPTVLFSSHCVKRPFANRGRKLAEKLAVPGEPRCRSSSKTHRIPWARCVQIPFYSSPCRSVLNGGEKANPRANTVFSPYYHAFLASGSTAASGWGGAGTAGWDPACTHALSSPLLWKQTTGQLFHAAHVGGSPQAE